MIEYPAHYESFHFVKALYGDFGKYEFYLESYKPLTENLRKFVDRQIHTDSIETSIELSATYPIVYRNFYIITSRGIFPVAIRIKKDKTVITFSIDIMNQSMTLSAFGHWDPTPKYLDVAYHPCHGLFLNVHTSNDFNASYREYALHPILNIMTQFAVNIETTKYYQVNMETKSFIITVLDGQIHPYSIREVYSILWEKYTELKKYLIAFEVKDDNPILKVLINRKKPYQQKIMYVGTDSSNDGVRDVIGFRDEYYEYSLKLITIEELKTSMELRKSLPYYIGGKLFIELLSSVHSDERSSEWIQVFKSIVTEDTKGKQVE